VSWRYPGPRQAWELRLQRVGFVLLLAWRFPAIPRYSAQPIPAGVAQLVDVSWMGNAALANWIYAAFALALLGYLIDRAMLAALTVLAALWIGAGALASSQGSLAHDTQLVGLVLLAQWIAYARGAWASWRRGVPRRAAHELAVDYTQQVVVATYLLAGLMKLVLSRGAWIAMAPNVATDIVKVHGQRAADALDASLIARGDRLAAFALTHTTAIRLMMGGAWLLELSSPVALLGRIPAMLYGGALIGMHRGIEYLMMIRFYENEALLLIYFVNLPYLLVWAARYCDRTRRRRNHHSDSAVATGVPPA